MATSLFVVFTTVTYLSSNTRLFMLIALTAVGTITTVYVGIFRPGQIGWGSTYTFDGILVATLVMVVVDTSGSGPRLPNRRLLQVYRRRPGAHAKTLSSC